MDSLLLAARKNKVDSVDQKHQKIAALLEDYPEKIGIGKLKPVNEVNHFLTIEQSELRRMSAEECGEASVILNQSATYVQLEQNKISADIEWCESYLQFIIAGEIGNIGTQYMPYEYRKALAIKQNDVAMSLQGIITKAKLRMNLLNYLPNQLRNLSASFADLQQTKRQQRG